MDEPSNNRILLTRADKTEASTFQSIFFSDGKAKPIRVPDYQRAFSWEQKQIELFIGDLVKYQGGDKGYYFGHFIAQDIGSHWEIVDGQQRITTFVLFLMVCRAISPSDDNVAYSMIQQFSTVSYDRDALETIGRNLGSFLERNGHFDERKPPTDTQIIEGLSLSEKDFTRSQRRMVLALLRFNHAFYEGSKQKKGLEQEKIGDYFAAVMKAQCSQHLTQNQSVAVNIFEMHNTRGIPLTTLEIIKAMLIKFVYDYGGENRELKAGQVQAEFGEIYGMEERVAELSFRGEMTMEQLLRLHLRVVDDGTKKAEKDFHYPATNADSDTLVSYVSSRLNFIDGDETKPKSRRDGAQYALNLAKEFKKSVRIVSKILPAWDKEDALVGDVLILDQEWSCQFFLIVCRALESGVDNADGRMENASLLLWEQLLFTRDFHDKYYNLKGSRDNFQALFESCAADKNRIREVISGYLENGFRQDRTKELQSIVAAYLIEHKENILNGAFHWHPWKSKMIYAIYKYEISRGAKKIRDVMKGTVSVEHILPQEWQWEWIDGCQEASELSLEKKEAILKETGTFINGLGNLLILTPGENTSQGNNHPAEKQYNYSGGSYEEHNQTREAWKSSKKWSELIRARGEEIFKFMLHTLVKNSK